MTDAVVIVSTHRPGSVSLTCASGPRESGLTPASFSLGNNSLDSAIPTAPLTSDFLDCRVRTFHTLTPTLRQVLASCDVAGQVSKRQLGLHVTDRTSQFQLFGCGDDLERRRPTIDQGI